MFKRIFACMLLCLLLLSACAEGPEAVLRDRTLIVKIPDLWIEACVEDTSLLTKDTFHAVDDWIPLRRTEMVANRARLYLEERRAYAFIADCMDGFAEPVSGYRASGTSNDLGAVIMAQQHMDGAWFTVSHLSSDDLSNLQLSCSITCYELSMPDSVLHVAEVGSRYIPLNIDITDLSGRDRSFSQDGISIYDVFWNPLAVVTQKDTDEETLWRAAPRIDGQPSEIVSGGFFAGFRNASGDAVYCFFLSEEERGKLMQGSSCTMVQTDTY